jgi:hypothetical protein
LGLQHRLTLRRKLNLLGRKPGKPVKILFTLSYDELSSQFLNPLFDFHQPERRNTFFRDVMLV